MSHQTWDNHKTRSEFECIIFDSKEIEAQQLVNDAINCIQQSFCVLFRTSVSSRLVQFEFTIIESVELRLV